MAVDVPETVTETVAVHAVSKLRSKPSYSGPRQCQGTGCHRCGDPSHSGDSCKVKDYTCHHCHKKGHLACVSFEEVTEPESAASTPHIISFPWSYASSRSRG